MFSLFREIELCDIDENDQRYKVSFGTGDISFLAGSIKKLGLITPLLLKPVKKKFVIISGFNRVKALLQINEMKAPAYIIDDNTNDYQCLLLAITRLSFKRPMTHSELILSLQRLLVYIDKKEIIEISPSVFNMQITGNFIDDLIQIASLPPLALDLIRSGNLSLKAAKKISFLNPESIEFFLHIFEKLKYSLSIQLEVIQNILEISGRDGASPAFLFKTLNMENHLDDGSIDAVTKAHKFRSLIFDMRFPLLSETRKRVSDKIAFANLPKAIKIKPPEFFENRMYSVSFVAGNYNEFQKNVYHLMDSLGNETLIEILNS